MFWKNNNLKQSDRIKKYEEDSLKSHALNIILGGSIAFLIVIIIELILPDKYEHNRIYQIIFSVTTHLINIVLAVGVGSLILEYFGFIDYMRKRIRDVIIENEYLDILHLDKKKELKSRLEKLIYYPKVKEVPKDSLFYVVQNEIEPLLQDNYYKEYIVSVDCSIDGAYIKKKIFKQMTFSQMNPEELKPIGILLNSWLYKINDKSDQEIFKLNRCLLNNEPCNLNINYKEINDAIYNKRVVLECTNCLNKDEDSILEIEYETLVPIEDCYFINRVNKPCQHYVIHFNYDPNEVNIFAQGFGFMESGKQERMTVRTEKNGKVIRFKNWILPGDGTIFTILKKNN